jgi:hypothetical protein
VADSVEEAIRTYLTNDATFTAKFEGVYWYEADSTTYPYIVFWQVDDAGTQSYIDRTRQGEARIQFDVWDSNKFRGVRLRSDVREKIEDLNETVGGYMLRTVSVNETTVQRQDGQAPYHFIADAVIAWHKG